MTLAHYHVFQTSFDPRYEKCGCGEQRRTDSLSPRAQGQAAGIAALATAERVAGFDAVAVERIFLDYLSEHGQAFGEDLTDAAKKAGHVPHDDRAFGPIFAALARSRAIRVVGYGERRKGHGTSGARMWAKA